MSARRQIRPKDELQSPRVDGESLRQGNRIRSEKNKAVTAPSVERLQPERGSLSKRDAAANRYGGRESSETIDCEKPAKGRRPELLRQNCLDRPYSRKDPPSLAECIT